MTHGRPRLRTAVLISGSGTNLQALINASHHPDCPYLVVLVVSNEPGAGGLGRAEAAGIRTAVIPHRGFATRQGFDAALNSTLREADVELVCLAGFMRILTPGFIAGWTDRLINIHPSLLPLFRGLHTHRQALAAGVRVHGCSIHHVVPELDAGPIIAQAAVRVLPGDTEDTLAARVLIQEHRLYPAAVARVARALLGEDEETAPHDDGAALVSPLIG